MPTSSHDRHDPSDLHEVDRLLRQLNPGAVSRTPLAESAPGFRPGSTADPPAVRPASAGPTPLAAWSRVVLGALLAGAMTQWPYATCGPDLAAYLFAAGAVIGMGVWGSLSAWATRQGWAHVLGIATLIAGITLAAVQLLPRLGYAGLWMPWACGG